MTQHCFSNYLTVRDNYFNDPMSVIEISKLQKFSRGKVFPGFRTQNLLEEKHEETRAFARSFAERLSFDAFPGMTNFTISVYFHKNEVYENDILNSGWIHNDNSLLAGLVYLNEQEENFNNGTSFFNETGKEDPEDEFARRVFNANLEVSKQYIASLKNNWSQFSEITRVGNKFNRLVAYDAKLFHRPNSYITSTGDPRLTLLFFISKFDYVHHNLWNSNLKIERD